MTGDARARPPRRLSGLWGLVRLGLATLCVGIATGLAVLLLVWIVHSVEHLVWGSAEGPFLDGLALPSPWWLPIVSLSAAGVIAALGWYLLRRFGRRIASVEEGVAGKRMPALETLADTVIQVTSVGLGASIGKEVAPRELSAMAGSKLVGWFRIDARWSMILVASAAGAGLAAVYNVPLAGALFAIEILLARFSAGAAVVALSVSAIATVVARPLVADDALYHVAPVAVTPSLLVAAVLIGPLMGWGATSFSAVTARLSRRRPTGWKLLIVLPLTFAAVGVLGAFFPLILGNGRALATAGFDLGVHLARCRRHGTGHRRGGGVPCRQHARALHGDRADHRVHRDGFHPAAADLPRGRGLARGIPPHDGWRSAPLRTNRSRSGVSVSSARSTACGRGRRSSGRSSATC